MTDNISVLIMGVDESEIRDKTYGKQLVQMHYYLPQLIKNDKSVLACQYSNVIHVYTLHISDKYDNNYTCARIRWCRYHDYTVENFRMFQLNYSVKFNF